MCFRSVGTDGERTASTDEWRNGKRSGLKNRRPQGACGFESHLVHCRRTAASSSPLARTGTGAACGGPILRCGGYGASVDSSRGPAAAARAGGFRRLPARRAAG